MPKFKIRVYKVSKCHDVEVTALNLDVAKTKALEHIKEYKWHHSPEKQIAVYVDKIKSS